MLLLLMVSPFVQFIQSKSNINDILFLESFYSLSVRSSQNADGYYFYGVGRKRKKQDIFYLSYFCVRLDNHN